MKNLVKVLAISAMALWTTASFAKDVNQDFDVSGWTCGGCSGKTVRAVKSLDGVKEAKAATDDGILMVTYDDAMVKSDDILAAIKKSGYSCKLKKDKDS